MRKQHLDLLSLPSRGEVDVACHDIAGQIARTFVDRAHDLTGRHVWRAALLKGAGTAVLLPGPVSDEAILIDVGSRHGEVAITRSQALASWTDIAVISRVESKGRALERAIGTGGLVEHRDMRRDALLLRSSPPASED